VGAPGRTRAPAGSRGGRARCRGGLVRGMTPDRLGWRLEAMQACRPLVLAR
jgi:hypothetical protein